MHELKTAVFEGLKTREGYVGDRPVLRAMDALDMGRVAAPDPALPGLGPTLAENAAKRALDLRQSLQFPKEREAVPLVGRPEMMSAERNASLFPSGPSNDERKALDFLIETPLIVAATENDHER